MFHVPESWEEISIGCEGAYRLDAAFMNPLAEALVIQPPCTQPRPLFAPLALRAPNLSHIAYAELNIPLRVHAPSELMKALNSETLTGGGRTCDRTAATAAASLRAIISKIPTPVVASSSSPWTPVPVIAALHSHVNGLRQVLEIKGNALSGVPYTVLISTVGTPKKLLLRPYAMCMGRENNAEASGDALEHLDVDEDLQNFECDTHPLLCGQGDSTSPRWSNKLSRL